LNTFSYIWQLRGTARAHRKAARHTGSPRAAGPAPEQTDHPPAVRGQARGTGCTRCGESLVRPAAAPAPADPPRARVPQARGAGEQWVSAGCSRASSCKTSLCTIAHVCAPSRVRVSSATSTGCPISSDLAAVDLAIAPASQDTWYLGAQQRQHIH
jgi:hypothetical protein